MDPSKQWFKSERIAVANCLMETLREAVGDDPDKEATTSLARQFTKRIEFVLTQPQHVLEANRPYLLTPDPQLQIV